MTARRVSFEVPGEPQGKGRAKVVKIGGFTRMATPSRTVAYEGIIAHAAAQAMAHAPLLSGPCFVHVVALFTVPASWSMRKRQAALNGKVWPTKKPDSDNILKAVCDGINGVVWRDDVQAVVSTVEKGYGLTPGLRVVIETLGQGDAA